MAAAASIPPFYAGDGGPASTVPAAVTVPITQRLGAEYVPLFHDALRMLCIQATIQLMSHLSQEDAIVSRPLLSADFIMLLLYVVLGVMLYWLAVRRLIAFE